LTALLALAGIVTLLMAAPPPATAQEGNWRPLGPSAATTWTLRANPALPALVYAAGASGLWHSSDGGASWQQLPAGSRVDAIAVQPANPAQFFVICWICQAVQESQDSGRTWATIAGAAPSAELRGLLLQEGGVWLGGRSGVWQTPVPLDLRYYPQTGFRITDDSFWNYFQHRGGVQTFGYPTSRTFPFLGFPTQFFQRQVMQRWPDGSVHLLNLLDPGIMPYASFNFSIFPAQDAGLTTQAPTVGNAGYGAAIIAFVQQHAPDTWNGLPVRFSTTFTRSVTTQMAFGSSSGSALVPALNLELWGIPTSRPAYDPHNHGFVYLRFQRGSMQYDASCNCTGGILLADTFKSVLLAGHPDLAAPPPADVRLQLAGSPYLGLYDAHTVDAVSLLKPGTENIPRAGGTNLAFAFSTG